MATSNAARRASARRPITPLTDIAQAVVSGGVQRRAAAVATASGLLISTFGAAANASSGVNLGASTEPTSDSAGLDLSPLAAQARAALEARPAVTVAELAELEIEAITSEGIATVAAAPAPAPVVLEPVRVEAPASRTTDRAPVGEPGEGAAPAVPVAPAPPSAAGSAVLEIAARYVGVPYVFGGTTPAGFDCSGFTQYVYGQLGIALPRTDAGQRGAGTVVSWAEAQPGDLIWTPGHVAIYAGDGMMIDAPRPGLTVQFRAIWAANPTFIRIG